jgi:COMPASS component SWD2
MTSSSDETIQIYNVREGRHDKSALSKKYGVKLAKFTHTKSSIIYASTKQNRKYWPKTIWRILVCLPLPVADTPMHCTASDAIRYLATHDNSFIRYFEGHQGDVTCLAVHPGSDSFISCSQDNTVRIWDTQTKHFQGQLNLKTPTLAAYDPSGTVFAVACPSAGSVLLYDLRQFDKAPFTTIDIIEQVRRIDPQYLVRGWTKLEFSNDGQSLLLGTKGSGHFLLDAFEGTLKAYLHKPQGGTRRLAPGEAEGAAVNRGGTTSSSDSARIDSSGDCCFAPDGRFVLSGSKKDVLVWDTRNAPANENKVLDPTYTLQDKREAAVIGFNPRFNFFASADQELLFWLPDPHG